MRTVENIVVDNVSKSFGENKVLDGFSCAFHGGGYNCIMGRSGSGKTTLFMICAGLMQPDSGTVSGIDTKHIGAVFQEDRLCPQFSAFRNIKIACEGKISDDEIIKALDDVGITNVKNKPVKDFSGGMKRRVAIVRAVLCGADTLFFDEPFKGLDETTKLSVMNFVKQRTVGKTVIIITHDESDVHFFGGSLIML